MGNVTALTLHYRNMHRRVLIMMSDTGGGHRAVSRAVAEALADSGQVAESPIVDLFAVGERRLLVDRITRLYGPVIRTAPQLYGLAYHFTDNPTTYEMMARGSEKPLADRAVGIIEEHRPDIVVSIHGLVTRPMAQAIQRTGRDIPLVTVVPDLVRLHRCWIQPEVVKYTAPTPEAVDFLQGYGVAQEKIILTGLPVEKKFAKEQDQRAIRESLGLSPGTFTVLIVGGGEGSNALPLYVKAIDERRLNLQMIVVCGKNKDALDKIRAMTLRTPTRAFGFAQNMPDLVWASDLVITKGGPQSLSEALVAGRPVLVTQLLPGQEQGNDIYVVNGGAGYRVKSAPQVAEALARLAEDKKEFDRLAEGARKLAQPHAAEAVAKVILEVATR